MPLSARPSSPDAHEVVLPARALAGLGAALRDEAGPVVAAQALHRAGYRAAELVFRQLDSVHAGSEEGAEVSLWNALARHFADRGWGTLRHDAPHPAVGLLESDDWAEAGGGGRDGRPACSFSTGLLAGILTRATGSPVAVLEVECRSRGDERCVFAFGTEVVVRELHAHLLEGRSLEQALEEL